MPIQGLKFSINSTQEAHRSFQSTGSFVAYNPNDGVANIALDRTATNLDYDHRLPSQSGGRFPGPINSYLSIYYLDQGGSGATGQIMIYGTPEEINVPHFWSIGRAVQTAGSIMDISQGSQPSNPPLNTSRLWADGNGDLHVLGPTGVDNIVYDSSNIGTAAVGGDAYGTIGDLRHAVLYNHAYEMYDQGGTRRIFAFMMGAETRIRAVDTGSMAFVNQANSAYHMIVNSSGVTSYGYFQTGTGYYYGANFNTYLLMDGSNNILRSAGGTYLQSLGGANIQPLFCGGITAASSITASGHVYATAGYLWTGDGTNGIVQSSQGVLYVRAASGLVAIDGAGGLSVTNDIMARDINFRQAIGVSTGLGTGAGAQQQMFSFRNTQGNNVYLNLWSYRQAAGASWPTHALVLAADIDTPFNKAAGWITFLNGKIGINCYPTGTLENLQVFGEVYFSGATIRWGGTAIYFDNTYIHPSHSFMFNSTGNQVAWPNGSYISGNAGYVQGSDKALKQGSYSVLDSKLLGIVKDKRLPVKSYYWQTDTTRRNIGFMAEDIARVLPQSVVKDNNGKAAGYSPQELIAVLWGAVRELESRVSALGG